MATGWQNRSKVEVVANSIQLLGGGGSQANNGNGGSGYFDRGTTENPAMNNGNVSQNIATPPASVIPDTIPDDFDDDIPF